MIFIFKFQISTPPPPLLLLISDKSLSTYKSDKAEVCILFNNNFDFQIEKAFIDPRHCLRQLNNRDEFNLT